VRDEGSGGRVPKSPRMWSRRRRRSAPPVILPSLDRLATLIERVVELIDAVGATQSQAPEPDAGHPREPSAVPVADGGEEAWLAFVPSPDGYRLFERAGPPPRGGEALELDGERYRVLRFAPSPLPGDRRRCAYLEREEPPSQDRSFDA
jgi:hypothetical protein